MNQRRIHEIYDFQSKMSAVRLLFDNQVKWRVEVLTELIYEPVRKLVEEKRPLWSYVFENKMLKINTHTNHVDDEILQEIKNLGFRVNEIGYLEKFGIIFSVVEESLS